MVILNLDGNPIVDNEIKGKGINFNESKINKNLKLTLNKKSSDKDNQELDILKLKEKCSSSS